MNKIFNIQPKRLNQLINEVMAEINADGGMQDCIRKEKACKIEDIFRSAKFAQLHEPKFVAILGSPVEFFDKLYDLDLHALEAYSIALDNCNTRYMQEQMRKNNRTDWNPKKDDDNGWLHLDIR